MNRNVWGIGLMILALGCGKPSSVSNNADSGNVVKVEEANIDQLTIMIQDDPDNPEYLYYRGLRYMDGEDYTRAIGDFNQSIEADSTNPVTWFNRGTAKFSLDDFQGALIDYNKAILLKPNYADAYFNRAVLFDSKEDFESAAADYSKVLEFQPENLDAKYYRGVDYLMLKKTDLACDDFKILADQGYEDGKNAYQKYCVKTK